MKFLRVMGRNHLVVLSMNETHSSVGIPLTHLLQVTSYVQLVNIEIRLLFHLALDAAEETGEEEVEATAED